MNQFKSVALPGLFSVLITISYWIIGGWSGVVVGVAIATLTTLGSWYFSDRIALAASGAQPVTVTPNQTPGLYSMVQRLRDRGGLPIPAIYIVPNPAANAFATGRDPERAPVAVTEGILELLADDELEAVIAHELSQVRNRDTLTQAVAPIIGGAISFLVQIVSYSIWFGGSASDDREGANPLGLLVSVILAPVAATVIQLERSRTREFSADAGSAQVTGNPRALARALQRLENNARQMQMQGKPAFEPLVIVNAFSGEFLGNLFSIHPSTEARIKQLLQLEKDISGNASPMMSEFLK